MKLSLLLILCCYQCIQSALLQTQLVALEELYNNTNGPEWNTNTNWLVGDPCSDNWFGLACDKSERNLETIDLRQNNLNGPLPNSFADAFPQLVKM
jgi:hypothetical protein